ncbi:MAG: hypothetical protein WC443_12100 [Desulfobaccales bacterium]
MGDAQSTIPPPQAPAKTSDEAIKKYAELYQMAKEVFAQELDRFHRLDQKASMLLSALTVIIGAFTLAIKGLHPECLPPSSCLEYIIIASCLLLFFCLAKSWYHLVSVLCLHTVRRAPLNEDSLNFFNDNRLIDIYFSQAKRFAEFLPENMAKTDLKAAHFGKAYWWLRVALFVFIAVALSYALWLAFQEVPS